MCYLIAGRFEEQFVETRRSALERALGKMANHPVLSLDPDLKLFLSSDAFTIDVSLRSFRVMQPVTSTDSPLEWHRSSIADKK
jgi:sorting nexin-1/2